MVAHPHQSLSCKHGARRRGVARLLAGLVLAASCGNAAAQATERLQVAAVETDVAQAQKADIPPASPTTGAPLPSGGNPRALYRALIEREVSKTRLPADVAEAVMGVESGYDRSRIGGSGEIGLMQVMPSTARMLGFTGTMAEFAAPEINIKYGVLYLSQAWAIAGGDLCTALMKYRAGHGETRFSQLSVDYCVRARSRLFAKGYPVTGTVPIATFGFRDGIGGGRGLAAAHCGRRCLTIGGGRVDFAALNGRLAQVVIQVSGPRQQAK